MRCEQIEVGCRGFAGQSLCRAFNTLGITGAFSRRAIKLMTDAAVVALRWMWVKIRDRWVVGQPRHRPGLEQPQLGHLGEHV